MNKPGLTSTLTVTLLAMVLKATYAAAPVCGDVNDSGNLTSVDALMVLRGAVGQPVDLMCGPASQPLTTGQTTDYGPGTDGAVKAGAARSFADNGDGTITDNTTGLMWEKKDDAGGIHDKDNAYTWSAGSGNMDGTIVTEFLATLNAGDGFAGYNDWRVPNIFELESLRNMGAVAPATYSAFRFDCEPGCTLLACSCTQSSEYWSSSTYKGGPQGAWYVNSPVGFTDYTSKTFGLYVRAVRAGS